MTAMTNFDGKVALITGAADGIGLALATALAQAGARVFASDIAADKLKESASQIGVASAPCDVADEGAMAELVDRATAELGPIDLLCANAGVIVPGSILELSREDIDWIFSVNVWGIVNACKPFVRRLREDGRGGHILLTGSEHSLSNPRYLRWMALHAYNMTKHAVLSLGESLRAELETEGVGVSVLCPGPVVSGLAENSGTHRPAHAGERRAVEIPEMSPEEVERLSKQYMPAARAAEIALAGIRAGAFVIPTHPFEKDDVDARYQEMLEGFALLD